MEILLWIGGYLFAGMIASTILAAAMKDEQMVNPASVFFWPLIAMFMVIAFAGWVLIEVPQFCARKIIEALK